ncbi:MAG: hypothetical protein SPC78_06025, partial [Candidatus Faecousia sp.]|nr:hypothetical protein [Candidatus Faecousia sp.]
MIPGIRPILFAASFLALFFISFLVLYLIPVFGIISPSLFKEATQMEKKQKISTRKIVFVALMAALTVAGSAL